MSGWKRAAIVLMAGHAVAGCLFLVPGYLNPDSVAIYSYLRSPLFDRDLLFFNEWGGMGLISDGVTLYKEITPVGALANHWWVGTAMLAAPPYLLARLGDAATGTGGNGFSGIYAFVLAWSTVAFAAGASLLSMRFIAADAGGGSGAGRAVAAIALVWLGTPLFFYELRFPLGTHLAGALAVAAAVVFLVRAAREDDRTAALICGLWFGLAVAVRLQHLMLAPAALVYLAAWRRPRLIAIVAAGAALPAAVQAIAWLGIYGHPLGPLVSGASHMGSTWMPFTRNALAPVLFSSYHGLISWSPVVLLSFAGWAAAVRDERSREATLFILMFAGEWIANGLFDRYFWGGLSFGARRFIDLALPFSVGAWWCLRRWPVASLAFGIPAAAWSALLGVAAAAGTLDLSRDVSAGGLVRSVAAVDSSSALAALQASPLLSGRAPLLTLGSLVLVATVYAAVALASRTGRRHASLLTAYVVVCAITAAMLIPRTRSTAAQWREILGVDDELSATVGPLLDARYLLEQELAFLKRTGRPAAADVTRRELAEIDRRLAAAGRRGAE
jgi:hypothetical protein